MSVQEEASFYHELMAAKKRIEQLERDLESSREARKCLADAIKGIERADRELDQKFADMKAAISRVRRLDVFGLKNHSEYAHGWNDCRKLFMDMRDDALEGIE